MKISKKEDFALLFMGVLAKNYSSDFVSIATISSETNLPKFFLKQIASSLKNKELIESREGIQGGYRLVSHPKKINVATILRAVSGGNLRFSCIYKACRIDKTSCNCAKFWRKVNLKLGELFQKTSLYDFVKL